MNLLHKTLLFCINLRGQLKAFNNKLYSNGYMLTEECIPQTLRCDISQRKIALLQNYRLMLSHCEYNLGITMQSPMSPNG